MPLMSYEDEARSSSVLNSTPRPLLIYEPLIRKKLSLAYCDLIILGLLLFVVRCEKSAKMKDTLEKGAAEFSAASAAADKASDTLDFVSNLVQSRGLKLPGMRSFMFSSQAIEAPGVRRV